MEQPDLNELHTKFSTHEAQCEERWKTIFGRLEGIEAKMDRLQFLLLGATGTVILFLGGIILKLVG
ncbi:hypothetical protein CMK18_21675 [Candidatus Poribacteria bacterium]|nr:hypothetical protein [Candidatus Poribacteria bacterium]